MRGGGEWFPVLITMILFLLAVKLWPHAKRRFMRGRHGSDTQDQDGGNDTWQRYEHCDN